MKARSPAKKRRQRRAVRDKVKAHRARLRAQGLRPIQIWVPDTRSAAFAREAARQSRLVAESPGEEEDLAFIEAISEWPPDDAAE
jgi:hypothetical protein